MSEPWPKVGRQYYTSDYWLSGTISGYVGYGESWAIHKEIGLLLAHVLSPASDSKVLDVGGCFGFHLGWLSVFSNIRGFVVDASEYAINHIHSSIEEAYWLDAGVDKLPWKDGYFDHLVSIETFEHIYEPEVDFAFSEMFRVMRDGATAYSSVDVKDEADPDFIDRTHQTMHPEDWWIEKLIKAGFNIREDLRSKARDFRLEDGTHLCAKMKWTVICFSKGGNCG